MTYKLPKEVARIIFRENDIRGDVDSALTPDVVYAIGLSFGTMVRQHELSEVIIGRDGRLSSPMLSKALAAGLAASGCDVIDIGAVPTPFVYFATKVLSASCGIMLTGSHNKANDNGLKIIFDRQILSPLGIQSLYERILRREFSRGTGHTHKLDIVPSYIARALDGVKMKRRLKVVVDAGNGVTGLVGPKLLRAAGCEVVELYCNVDGTFPNHHPNPGDPETLKDLIRKVQEEKADLGVAFDGDGDRLGVVTNEGKIIWPDRLLMYFAKALLEQSPGRVIMYDVKCSAALDGFIRKYGGRPLMWKTGHSFIKAKLVEENALLAGEFSGHFYFNDHWFGFDDGLYSSVRLLEMLSRDDRTLGEIFDTLPSSNSTPEIDIPYADDKKRHFVAAFQQSAKFEGGKSSTLDGLRVDFEYGFGLVRASNTTPNLVLRFEADSAVNLKRIVESFYEQMLMVDPGIGGYSSKFSEFT